VEAVAVAAASAAAVAAAAAMAASAEAAAGPVAEEAGPKPTVEVTAAVGGAEVAEGAEARTKAGMAAGMAVATAAAVVVLGIAAGVVAGGPAGAGSSSCGMALPSPSRRPPGGRNRTLSTRFLTSNVADISHMNSGSSAPPATAASPPSAPTPAATFASFALAQSGPRASFGSGTLTWCHPSSAFMYWRKFHLRATFESSSSSYSFKHLDPSAVIVGLIGSTGTAQP